jgi:RNA polymerase sigma-70 factor (ECF subfamily)
MNSELGTASDAALVVAVARFREDALGEIYRRHADVALGVAARMLGDGALAQDVVQDVFVRLWNDPERFDPARGSLRSFLLAGVRSRSIDVIRSEASRRNREVRHGRFSSAVDHDLEREVLDLTMAEHVRASVALLSDGERRAIELAYFGGHSYREVAEILDEPEGTVKSRIRSGLRRLRDSLVAAGVTGTAWTES